MCYAWQPTTDSFHSFWEMEGGLLCVGWGGVTKGYIDLSLLVFHLINVWGEPLVIIPSMQICTLTDIPKAQIYWYSRIEARAVEEDLKTFCFIRSFLQH